MKKLVFMFAAIVAVSFASCGNKTQTVEVENDTTVAVDTVAADTVAADTAAVDSAAV